MKFFLFLNVGFYWYKFPVWNIFCCVSYIFGPGIWPQDWKRSVFIPIPKKGNDKECSNYLTIALISTSPISQFQSSLCQNFSNRCFTDPSPSKSVLANSRRHWLSSKGKQLSDSLKFWKHLSDKASLKTLPNFPHCLICPPLYFTET